MRDHHHIRREIGIWIVFFIGALWLSGITAVPLEWGTAWLADLTRNWPGPWHAWAQRSADAVAEVAARHAFLLYGTDRLAFAHVVIGIAFFGPLRDPVRNAWVIERGLWCCLLVLLLAFLWPPVRGIPFFWRCVDASFGVLGALPLWRVRVLIARLEHHRVPAP
ncbi:MAG TPA: hypothetical protein PLH93_04495 [Flavobacteriales bacterium]|nr:hypothetical protein [Flavobacteriales bacterium]HQW86419.1 hypothetical protein [Flavobacteriales bacterium]